MGDTSLVVAVLSEVLASLAVTPLWDLSTECRHLSREEFIWMLTSTSPVENHERMSLEGDSIYSYTRLAGMAERCNLCQEDTRGKVSRRVGSKKADSHLVDEPVGPQPSVHASRRLYLRG